MLKIKLLILLLTNFLIFSCSENKIYQIKQKYNVGYIGGELDGLILNNYLKAYLKNLDIYDENSNYEINAHIEHSSKIYITNIDNTSDRENISTKLTIQIIDNISECVIYDDEVNVSQFYIFASNDKFLSNQKAVRKIKKENTYSTVRKFINKLNFIEIKCNEFKQSNKIN